MAQFTLNASFSSDVLDTFYVTGTNVIIAKPANNGTPNVAWQVFSPLQQNQLTWTEQYGIYASNQEVANGVVLTQMSNVPIGAAMNQLYTLEASGVITGPSTGGQSSSFSLQNSYSPQPYMTIGLFQDAVVNGAEVTGNAISAVPVLLASTAVMTPYTTVYIWVQSQVVSNTVVTTVTSPMTELTFGGGVNEISVGYDPGSGTFLYTNGVN